MISLLSVFHKNHNFFKVKMLFDIDSKNNVLLLICLRIGFNTFSLMIESYIFFQKL